MENARVDDHVEYQRTLCCLQHVTMSAPSVNRIGAVSKAVLEPLGGVNPYENYAIIHVFLRCIGYTGGLVIARMRVTGRMLNSG